jgi:hypothetical protein
MMTMARKPKGKVIPLKTVAQLKIDLDLLREELRVARENVTALNATNDAMAAHYNQEKLNLALLFTDIRNLVQRDPEPQGPCGFRTRVLTMVFPKFMLKQCARATQAMMWAKIVARLNDYNFAKYHEQHPRKTTATTTKIERND